MMNVVFKHFGRTLKVGKLAGIDFENLLNFQDISSQSELKLFLKQLNEQINTLKNIHLEKIKEIYDIEKEKLVLRDSKNFVNEILKKEGFYNINRETLLYFSFPELLDEVLVRNSLIHIYESNWKWCERDPFQNPFDFNKIFNANEFGHYFLLEKTGTYDDLIDSNVIEFPLTEYQFFLMQLFEEPRKVKDVLKEFKKAFEIVNIEEKKEFYVITKRLIKELIFRRFIVAPDKILSH